MLVRIRDKIKFYGKVFVKNIPYYYLFFNDIWDDSTIWEDISYFSRN
jgi:hypothetical protein